MMTARTGDLEPGARHLLDPATLAFFARCNGFPRTPAWLFLPDYDELCCADCLTRYGWSADEAGLASTIGRQSTGRKCWRS
jgi:hypothetical protein